MTIKHQSVETKFMEERERALKTLKNLDRRTFMKVAAASAGAVLARGLLPPHTFQLVNVANAAIINRDALIESLRAGRLGGVALDVHYQEPVPDDDELLKFDNVILTPRMAGSPRHNGLNDFEQLITGLARALAP